jgi:hypothetical protein
MSTQIATTPTAAAAAATRAVNNDDKTNQKRFHGFMAGVTSGVTKLVVGHPFGTQRNALKELVKGLPAR